MGLDLRSGGVLLEGYRVEDWLEFRELVPVDLGHLLELEDDVGAQVPCSGGIGLPFLQGDHPRPLQALEGGPDALLLQLLFLLALQERLVLLFISFSPASQEVREDVGDLPLDHKPCYKLLKYLFD